MVNRRSEAERCLSAGGAVSASVAQTGGFCPQSQLLKRILCAELQESKQAARMGVEVETITPGDGKMHHRWNRIDNSQTAILIYIKSAAF